MSTRRPGATTVRLADVARFAGVSTASVSRAVNEPRLVSAELRSRVARATQALNWVPNGAAKALASLRSRTIGAVIPSLGNPNFGRLVESLQRELAQANYTLLLGCAESRAVDLRLQVGREMVARGVEGLVLVGEAQPAALVELLKRRGVPCVMAYTGGTDADNTCIGFDNHQAAMRITRHLLGLGHRRFGMVTDALAWNDRVAQRVDGVKDALAQAGLGIKPHHLVEVDGARRVASGRIGLTRLLSTPDDGPTAVVCSNDYLAFGVMIEAASRAIAVPDQLSVTGFDDIDLSAQLAPALTTIRIPAEEIGETIARYLVQVLESGSAPRPAVLETQCMVRGSTAPAPAQRPSLAIGAA